MKKYILDLSVRAVERLSEKHILLKLTDSNPLPEMLPGQFVEVRVDGSSTTFLRRPISINFVDRQANEMWLMVAMVGEAVMSICEAITTTGRCCIFASSVTSLQDMVAMEVQAEAQEQMARTVTLMFLVALSFMMLKQVNTSAM